jgi:transmembrane sensor
MSLSHPTRGTPDWDALARFSAGESTPDEAARVSSWLESHPDHAELLAALTSSLDDGVRTNPRGEGDVDVEAALRRVHRRMDAPTSARPALHLSRRVAADASSSRRRWLLAGLAAAAAVMFAVSLVRDRSESGARNGGMARIAGANAGREIVTAVGVRDSVLLPDGSRVLLAPGSRLTISPSFGRLARDVSLVGVARFTVRHDTRAPFVVHAGPAIVRDVGTTFVVRAPSGESDAEVSIAVTEGEVAVAARPSPLESTRLRAGDRAELRATGQIVAQPGTVTDDDVAWTRGVLVYRAATLAVVRDDLRRWYGVELRVGDSSLASRRLTATFQGEGQPVEQVLNTIGLALGATVDRVGQVATLRRAAMPR